MLGLTPKNRTNVRNDSRFLIYNATRRIKFPGPEKAPRIAGDRTHYLHSRGVKRRGAEPEAAAAHEGPSFFPRSARSLPESPRCYRLQGQKQRSGSAGSVFS